LLRVSSRRAVLPLSFAPSAQHSATSKAPQTQRLTSPQSSEQHRVRDGPGMAARALELRSAIFLYVGCTRSPYRTARHRPSAIRDSVSRCLVFSHLSCPRMCACDREGSAVGTLRPGMGGACCHATALGRWQTHHVGEP